MKSEITLTCLDTSGHLVDYHVALQRYCQLRGAALKAAEGRIPIDGEVEALIIAVERLAETVAPRIDEEIVRMGGEPVFDDEYRMAALECPATSLVRVPKRGARRG